MDYQSLNKLAEDIFGMNNAKGFWNLLDIPSSPGHPMNTEHVDWVKSLRDDKALLAIPTKLALIHDEVSEALKVHREPDWSQAEFELELADIMIRVLDLAGHLRLDIGGAVKHKLDKNAKRPYMHNKRY